jgi:molybdopterin molybdotransferase
MATEDPPKAGRRPEGSVQTEDPPKAGRRPEGSVQTEDPPKAGRRPEGSVQTEASPPLAFAEARSRLFAAATLLPPERLPIALAAGRVLCTDVVAPGPLPPYDHSAMDGYAASTTDVTGSGPWALSVAGESSAGRQAPALAPRTCCRIYTGAPLPSRADVVIMQENVERDGDVIRFDVRPKAGQHIRRAGEDLAQGAIAVPSGTRLSPGCLALAAMLGRCEVTVARRPLVTILCTGDELLEPGGHPRPASIPESNSAALAALARQASAEVRVAPIARDDPSATQRAIEGALDGTDVLVTVGGVSVGDHDVVRPALERAGVSLDFWRVAIKPGKPLAVGRSSTAHVLGLPGNPASAIVTFTLFGMPLLRAMQGDARPLALPLRARLASSRRRSPDRLELVRATLRLDTDGLVVDACDNQSSGAATSLARSDGIAFVPPGDGEIAAGTFVDFVRWGDA